MRYYTPPKRLETIEDFLKSRQRRALLTTKLMKDICKRIKKLEKK